MNLMTRSGCSVQGSQWAAAAAARPCDSCGSAPSAVYCRADAAALCAACDADIHSANPLARRHQRDPILSGPAAHSAGAPAIAKVEESDEPWLLYHRGGAGFLFGGDVDEYLDLGEYNSGAESQFQEDRRRYEQLVPMECLVPNEHQNQHKQQLEHDQEQKDFLAGMGYDVSNPGFSYSTSLSHSVSFSSMEAGVVPETTTMIDALNSTLRASKGTIDLFAGPPLQMPPQFTPMDREAKVLRYREKRKTRKFEKTIRYASRKAYAETRPRIKGRFAKRSEVDLEVDQMFSTSEGSYGIVPSF